MEPQRTGLSFPTDIESEEGTTLPLQFNPLDQVAGANRGCVDAECIAIRKLGFLDNSMMQRFDELLIPCSFLQRYSIDVTNERRLPSSDLLTGGFVVHKNASNDQTLEQRKDVPPIASFPKDL
jgi:hypothetical protein